MLNNTYYILYIVYYTFELYKTLSIFLEKNYYFLLLLIYKI